MGNPNAALTDFIQLILPLALPLVRQKFKKPTSTTDFSGYGLENYYFKVDYNSIAVIFFNCFEFVQL